MVAGQPGERAQVAQGEGDGLPVAQRPAPAQGVALQGPGPPEVALGARDAPQVAQGQGHAVRVGRAPQEGQALLVQGRGRRRPLLVPHDRAQAAQGQARAVQVARPPEAARGSRSNRARARPASPRW